MNKYAQLNTGEIYICKWNHTYVVFSPQVWQGSVKKIECALIEHDVVILVNKNVSDTQEEIVELLCSRGVVYMNKFSFSASFTELT